MDTVIATIPKNPLEEIRVALREYKGRDLVDIRTYYQDDAGEWLPTKKGIALTVEQWPELRDALMKLDAHLPPEDTPPRRRSRRGGTPA